MPVVMEPMDYLRSVSIGVWILVGSVNETVSNNGISHMVEHMLFKGTKDRTAKELADDMAKIGDNMNAYTSKEFTSLYVTTLEEHLEETIEIMGDMICNSCLQESDIQKEKSVIEEEIDMYNDSPEDLVHEMLQNKIWGNHPLGFIISGEKKTVNGFVRNDLQEFMDNYYTADNMIISLAGGFDSEEVLHTLEKCFGNIKAHGRKQIIEKPMYYRSFYVQKKDIEQIHMNIAFESIDYYSQEKYVLSIVNSILGGSENSRLFQIIREELGLTYSIYSYGSSYDLAGLFHIDAILNPSKLFSVFHKILEIINELKNTGISEEELFRTKEQIKTEMIISNESTKTRMNSNGKTYLGRGRVVPIEETIDGLVKVTLNDVNSFLQNYFHPEKCSISLVGNLADVDMDLMKKTWEQL